MFQEKFDFYSPVTLKSYNLDQTMLSAKCFGNVRSFY